MSHTTVVKHGLSSDLEVQEDNGIKILLRSNGKGYLPGQARIQLQSPSFNSYLRKSHLITDLDRLAPYLKFIVTPSSCHIHPLHTHPTRNRTILVTENPGLHLVWTHDKIFITPIPPYLLDVAFWTYIRDADGEVYRAAAGFMRSYCYLIQYERDFKLATSAELCLISRETGQSPVTYEEFVGFIAQFEQLNDKDVAPRYAYGDLRLGKLNHLSRIFLHKLRYINLQPRWRDHIATFLAPMITLFAIISVVLSAMQVVLAAQSLEKASVFGSTSFWFSVVVLVLVALITGFFLVTVVFMGVKGEVYYWLMRKRGRSEKELSKSEEWR